MVSKRRALSVWQNSLDERIGAEEAEVVVDHVGSVVTQHDLREALDRQTAVQSGDVDRKIESLANRLMAAWRRDLLMISVPQFIALAAILLTVGA